MWYRHGQALSSYIKWPQLKYGKGKITATPSLYSWLEALTTYMDTGTIIVRGIAVRIALEVVPLRLQESEMKSKPFNNQTGTSEHSEHSLIGVT